MDYTKSTNNYDVGLPRKDKDGDNYPLIKAVKDVVGAPVTSDIEQMESFYKELASLRKSSPLFTLGTGAEVMKRVDFRNVGKTATPGLIAMTIDDGTGQTNLDPAVDGIVVILNATNATQTVGGFVNGTNEAIDLSDFVQSGVQTALGTASIGTGATAPAAADGTFSVPAWSVAVFVKPEVPGVRGTGLPVSKKQDPATIPPFGATEVHLPGKLIGNWDFTAANLFTFTNANYTYSLTTPAPVVAGSYAFKVATGTTWGGTEYAPCTAGAMVVGTPIELCPGAAGNIALTLTEDASYTLTLKVQDKAKAELTITKQ